MRRSAIFLLWITIILVIAVGCNSSDTEDKPVLAVSFPMQNAILKEIVGDSIDVITLIPQGSNPETFEPAVTTLRSLERASAFFTLSTPGFEQKITRQIKESGSEIQIVDCSKSIQPIPDSHGKGSADPHLWNSFKNARAIASEMLNYLVSNDPKHAAEYKARTEKLMGRLKAYDDSVASILRAAPSRCFVVIHPTLSYFARDYDLQQIAMEIEGKEPSPRQLSDRIETARGSQALILIHDKERDVSQANIIAHQLSLPVFSVSLNSENWENQLISIAHAIANAR